MISEKLLLHIMMITLNVLFAGKAPMENVTALPMKNIYDVAELLP